MSATNDYPDRGSIGATPAMTYRADEAFLSYIQDLRETWVLGQAKSVHPKADAAIDAAGIRVEPTKEAVEAVRALGRRAVPEAGVWARLYRSTQEAFWARVLESYAPREREFLKMLDDWDNRGPGTVDWDPGYVYPDYARVETHLQPGGYVGHPLAGLVFDYATRVWRGDFSEDDAMHEVLNEHIPTPKDGRVDRVMDIACSIGQLTCRLKRRFPEAEVWGSDISAPMVRYAHYRAAQQGHEIHFLQKAAEDLDDLPAGSYDLVTVHILFHEIPVSITDQVIKNVHRLLRPGGTFSITDFPTVGSKAKFNYEGFLGAIDSADNCEPFAPVFIRCDLESKLEAVGFTLREKEPGSSEFLRVADKPA